MPDAQHWVILMPDAQHWVILMPDAQHWVIMMPEHSNEPYWCLMHINESWMHSSESCMGTVTIFNARVGTPPWLYPQDVEWFTLIVFISNLIGQLENMLSLLPSVPNIINKRIRREGLGAAQNELRLQGEGHHTPNVRQRTTGDRTMPSCVQGVFKVALEVTLANVSSLYLRYV